MMTGRQIQLIGYVLKFSSENVPGKSKKKALAGAFFLMIYKIINL